MIIALHYDETYNKAPFMWDVVTKIAQLFGHEVILATYRHGILDMEPLLEKVSKKIECYYTDGKAKKPFLQELGINVDVWIDDNPNSILQDSAWKHDSPELHAWRVEKGLRSDYTVKRLPLGKLKKIKS